MAVIEINPFAGDRGEVLELLRICNAADAIDIPLFLESDDNPSEIESSFACSQDGALIGFAHLPDDPAPEACLMVHPDHRRGGIGRALFDALRAEARRRGLTHFLLVNDAASRSGTAFSRAAGAGNVSSEYRLLLDRAKVTRPERIPDFQLRAAGADEVQTLARIQATAFGDEIEQARDWVMHGFAEGNRHYYLGMLGDEPIGLLRTGAWEDGADITAFGVIPEHQGHGYGRQMLLDTIEILFREGWGSVTIEVATDNDHALGLYRSCGFDVTAKYDYYDIVV